MFESVVGRLRIGDGYYAAMGEELRRGYYPTASIFNWRTPLLYTFTAATLPRTRTVLFALLSVLVLGLTAWHLLELEKESLLIGLMVQVGALGAMWPWQAFTETWCGLLLALSLLTYVRGFAVIAAVFGMGALFVRELAAPYCVACVLLAWVARRKQELVAWVCGSVLYAAFYTSHVLHVWAAQRADAVAPAPWVRFGGLPYVLETIQRTNILFLDKPRILVTVAVVVFAAAWWAPTISAHLRAVLVAYVVFFAVVGQPFDDYWGFVTAPIFAVAAAYGMSGLRALLKAAAFPRIPAFARW